jgi:hypothetical protein
MRSAILAVASIMLVTLAATNAYAVEFVFDPLSGSATKQVDSAIPAALVAVALLVGALVIVLERKKARGIWFSNNERLK